MARLRRSSWGWGEAGAADAVEVGRLHGQGVEPVGQAAGGADHPFGGEGAQLLEQLGPAAGQALAQVGQYGLAGDAIEHQPATGRQKREPLSQLVFEMASAAAQQGPVAQIKAKAPVLLADEVEHREATLAGVGREPQAPAELLQKHHGALGGPQEQHGVDRGDVEPFVEEVHGEEDLQLAGLQAAQGGLAEIGGGGGVEGFGAEAAGREALGHEMGVFHAHAKTQGPHAGGIGHGVVELAEDQVHAAMVAGVDGAELGRHVAAAAPLQGGEIGGIGHGEVVEGGQQALIEGAPEAEFGGDATAEPVEDVEPVGPFGGGCEAEQELGAEVIEPAAITGGGGVVELIHDHHLEALGGDLREGAIGERLHRGEHMAPLAGH
jgi:hypothetical protein